MPFTQTSGAIVTNGSFEDPTVPVPGYFIYYPSGSQMPGWSINGSVVGESSYILSLSPGSPYDASSVSDGLQSLRLSWGDHLSQTLTGLIPGDSYFLSFDLLGLDPEDGDLRVRLGLEEKVFSSAHKDIQMLFVASGTTEELNMFAYFPPDDDGNGGAMIDNVRVTSVPEPHFAWLAGGGLLLTAFRRSRHQKNRYVQRRNHT